MQVKPASLFDLRFHALEFAVHGVSKPGANICLEHNFGADALVCQDKGGVAHDQHDLVPVAFDLGEHRGSAVGKAALANDAHDLGDLGG